ncbi:hypothetical protein GH714_035842 [Hevea brasiliensis]|uniref:Uncharacterized protein n=1 Tax=Hevea brasiliensis TaxID=3981 RepID=A0A6A6KVK2_HEVBR|nr:hypothetical protein GH714_035842 [Hevea brasiliensis]
MNGAMKNHERSVCSKHINKENIDSNVVRENMVILDPELSKTKGASKRIKSAIEKGHKRRNKKVRKSNVNSTSVEPMLESSTQGMDTYGSSTHD